MLKYLIIALAGLPLAARAQIKFDLTPDEARMVAQAVAQEPYARVAPLMQKLTQQYEASRKAAQAVPTQPQPPAPHS